MAKFSLEQIRAMAAAKRSGRLASRGAPAVMVSPHDEPAPPPPIELPFDDPALQVEIEQAVLKVFGWFGILDAELTSQIKRLINTNAPERLRPRLYELFRNKIGTVKLAKIIEVGVEGTLKNIERGEGGTATSMSDLV